MSNCDHSSLLVTIERQTLSVVNKFYFELIQINNNIKNLGHDFFQMANP